MQLQVVIAAGKIPGLDKVPILLDVLAHCGNDKLIPHIVWQNLHPLLASNPDGFLRALNGVDLRNASNVADMMPRIVDRLLAVPDLSPKALSELILSLGSPKGSREACAKSLAVVASKMQTGELAGARRESIGKELLPALQKLSNGPNLALSLEATFLAASLKDAPSLEATRLALGRPKELEGYRLKALAALVMAGDDQLLDAVATIFADPKTNSPGFRAQVLATLGKIDDARVAAIVLKNYAAMEPDLQPKAVDLLTQRPVWSKALLAQIAEKKLSANVLNVNQVRKLLASKDTEVTKQVTKVWGTIREGRNPEREKIVAQMRDMLKKTPGDARAGRLHFNKICAQCHKLYGEGQEIGPDITSNGRSDFEQLLSNVFDPSLVIGAGYTATTVVTTRGQTIAGLVAEDSPERIVLKTQGGKIETIPRGDIEQVLHSKLSYMPEDLEKQLQPQEIADLFAYLCLDRPPEDPRAKKIPGTPR